jgi:hypothetical protein
MKLARESWIFAAWVLKQIIKINKLSLKCISYLSGQTHS